MEESLLFANLASVNPTEKTQAFELVKTWIKKDGAKFRIKNLVKLFTLLRDNLNDQNWNVRKDALSLVGDLVGIISVENQPSLNFMFEPLFMNLGDTKVAIRKAALTAIEVNYNDYIKNFVRCVEYMFELF
jgi:hypothetical protein